MASLVRYPVKSMGGEFLDEAEVGRAAWWGTGGGRSGRRTAASAAVLDTDGAGRILRVLGRTHDLVLGPQATVLRGGTVRRGAPAVPT